MTGPLISDLELVETRRLSYEQMEWQTPALSLTAQAFLLTIALNPDVRSVGRLVASGLGVAVAVSVLQLYLKHRYHEELCAQWVDRKLIEEGRSGLYPKELESYAYPEGGKHQPVTTSLPGPDRTLVDWSSFRVWRAALWAFLVADVGVVALTLVEALGGPSVLGP